MTDRRILPAVFLATACAIGLLWLTEIPLGVVGPPFEWAWERIRIFDDQVAELVLGTVIAAAVGLAYLLVASFGTWRIDAKSRRGIAFRLLLLTTAGFFWLLAVQESPPSPHGLSKSPFVIYYKGPSGYYAEARYEMKDVGSYLARYQDRISVPNDPHRVLHIGTHPPGLVLFHRGLIEACSRYPDQTEWLEDFQPESVTVVIDTIAANSSGLQTPFTHVDRAALWLTALVAQLVAAATVIPLFVVLRRQLSASTAWRAAVFWPLVPAMAVFLPTSDSLHPFFGMSFLAIWLIGRQRNSVVLCLLSGVVFFAGMFLSLAVLPYALLAAVLTVWEVWRCDPPPVRDRVREGLLSVAWSLVGFFVPVAAMAVAFDLNLPRVWLTNFHNHGDFYGQYTRTYWKWLIANPIELAFAVGLPLAVVAVLAAIKTLRSGRAGNPRVWGITIGCAAVWAFLWLSGKNMGEAARLWIVIQPWAILVAAPAFGDGGNEVHQPESRRRHLSTVGWLIVLALQMIVCVATVTRVTGFNFTGG